ncbi:MAG: hypothetical protein JXQ73_00360 [Phycisphaerae bacterium]|nr:hypothetical protein [Phycisphaerae bacterium]
MNASSPNNPGQRRHRLRSVCWTLLLIPFLVLPYRWLWFPCALAGVVLVWPGRMSLAEVIRRDETLIVGSTVVLVLRTALDPEWWVPWTAVFGLLCWARSRAWWRPRLGAAAMPFTVIAAVFLLLRPEMRPVGNPGVGDGVDPNAVLVCAGDSLTSGIPPLSADDTYVAHLRKRLGCKVINAGVADNRTGDLLGRLDRDVLSHHPTAVLVFIGGNDYLYGIPRGRFASDLEQVVGRLAAARTRLVIVEVPSGVVWNNFAGIYGRVARRHGAALVRDSRLRCLYVSELLFRKYRSTPMTIDGIHLSPAGAAKVADWLTPYLEAALAD